MTEIIAYLRDRWEWDSAWRSQVSLVIIVGLIGLAFAWLETRIRAVGAPA